MALDHLSKPLLVQRGDWGPGHKNEGNTLDKKDKKLFPLEWGRSQGLKPGQAAGWRGRGLCACPRARKGLLHLPSGYRAPAQLARRGEGRRGFHKVQIGRVWLETAPWTQPDSLQVDSDVHMVRAGPGASMVPLHWLLLI